MMRRSVAVLDKPVKKTDAIKTCSHHWLIEPALGPTSEGICKFCGEKRTFLNIVEDDKPKSDLTRLFGSDDLKSAEKDGAVDDED